jgi:CRP-like cAMP-binding protein
MADLPLHDVLSKHSFFSGLAPAYLDLLARAASSRRLARDEVLFAYGKKASSFYLIRSGRVSVEVAAIEGPALELQVLGPDAVLGWSWLIAPYRWSFQARALEAAEVLEFDGRALLAAAEKDSNLESELLKRFSALMSERLGFAREKMMAEWKPSGFA